MNSIHAFRRGLLGPVEGYRFMRQHPKLWRYAIIPTALNIFLTLLGFILLIYVFNWANEYLQAKIHFGNESTSWFLSLWYGFAKWVLKIFAFAGLILLCLVGVIGIWFLLQNILCGYFYGILAKQTEIILGTDPSLLKEASVWYQATDAMRALFSFALVSIGLLLFHIVPVVGSLIATLGTWYYECYIFGYDYMDYAMELRGIRRKDKIALIKNNKAMTLGLGATATVMSFLPILGAFVLSTATVGAVLLYQDFDK